MHGAGWVGGTTCECINFGKVHLKYWMWNFIGIIITLLGFQPMLGVNIIVLVIMAIINSGIHTVLNVFFDLLQTLAYWTIEINYVLQLFN